MCGHSSSMVFKMISGIYVLLTLTSLSRTSAASNESMPKKKLLNGFPAAIWCESRMEDDRMERVHDNGSVKCQIMREKVKILDEYIPWQNRSEKGHFFNASSEWHNTTVSVSLTLSNGTIHVRKFLFVVEESKANPAQSRRPLISVIGKPALSSIYYCLTPTDLEDLFGTQELKDIMSEDQFNSITTVWRREGEIISKDDPDFQFLTPDYEEGRFGAIKFPNASFEKAPGLYKCTLEYGGHNLLASETRHCVRDDYTANQPAIASKTKTYVVAPGGDLNVSCHGLGMGSKYDRVIWTKNGTRLCYANFNRKEPCSIEFAITKFCHNASQEEITEARSMNRGNLTSRWTLKNITFENAGRYECKLRTTRKLVSAEFVIVVEKPSKTRSNLTVALAAVGGIFALFFLASAAYQWKKTEIRYLKKKLEKPLESARPVTFLVYSDDVFIHDLQKNPLNDVTQWMKTQGYAYFNPSDGISCLDAGEHVVDHSLKVLKNCLSMTVIITPKLLNENTLEIFKIYAGFEDNVRRNFPIVFICTKDMEKNIARKEKHAGSNKKRNEMQKCENEDALRTIGSFMKRNVVIHWKPDASQKFYRRLYVALPKARNEENPKYAQLQANEVFEEKEKRDACNGEHV